MNAQPSSKDGPISTPIMGPESHKDETRPCGVCGAPFRLGIAGATAGACAACSADRGQTIVFAPDEQPTTAAAPLSIPLPPGTLFRGLRVDSVLGKGGMGVVHRARQISLERDVALKLLWPRFATTEELVPRFEREAKLLASLNHPNIVHVYDFGSEGGLLFLTLEYVDGSTLAALLKQGRGTELLWFLRVMVDITKGLQKIHEAGLVHRDLKPANIFISRDGIPKIGDFGLAIETRDSLKLTQSGVFVGSPHYVSPEHVDEKTVDGRSDLYALGVILFEGIAGVPPFDGNNATSILVKQLREAPPDLKSKVPSVPPSVAAIVKKLLQKNPADRYPTPAALRADLVRAIQQIQKPPQAKATRPAPKPPPARVVPAPALPPTPLRKVPWRWVAAGFGAAAGVAVLLLVLFSPAPRRIETPPPPAAATALKQVVPVEPALRPAPAPKPESRKEEPAPTPPPREEARPLPPPPEPERAPREEVKPPPPETPPEPKPAPKPLEMPPKPPAPPPEPLPLRRLPVPDAAALKKAEKTVRDLFNVTAKSRLDRLAMSRKLRDAATSATTEDPAVRWVLLREARDLAAEALDLEAAFAAATVTAELFDVKPETLRAVAVASARKSASATEDAAALADTLLALVDQAWLAEDFEGVSAMAKDAEAVARTAKMLPLAERARDLGAESTEAKKDRDAARKASADDAVRGRYLCLWRGRWDEGLAILEKGNDAILKGLAAREAARAAPIELAQAWWEASQRKERGAPERRRYLLRAAFWCDQAWPGTSGLPKARILKRLDDIEAELPSRGVNLLARMDPARDSVESPWSIEGQRLISSEGPIAKVQIPYVPPAEYDLILTVARRSGMSSFNAGLVSAGHRFVVSIDGFAEYDITSIDKIDGKQGDMNETRLKEKQFGDERFHSLVFSVRRASVSVTLDGRRIVDWKGDLRRLSLSPAFTVPDERVLFLMTGATSYEVSRMILLPVSGSGQRLR